MASASHHQTTRTPWRHTILPWLAIGALLLPTAASADTANVLSVPLQALQTDLDPTTILLRDERIPILRESEWLFLLQDEVAELRKRDGTSTVETLTAATGSLLTASTAPATEVSTKAKTATTTPAKGTAHATTITETMTATSATTSSSPLPSILDSSLGSNYTDDSKCPAFIHSFLNDATFKSCYPFSMLLQAEKSIVATTQVLDATCAANATFCTGYLADLAERLIAADACGDDYKRGNSVVVQSYMGMVAYQPLYAASCLKDATTEAYCFASAITNTSTTANAYFYFLPLNISFPGSSRPTCNACLEQTMAIFRSATGNRSAAIASTYGAAAQQLNVFCGPSFANNTLAEAVSSGSARLTIGWMVPILSVAALMVL